ncbi:MAG: UDP-N-acetylmuramate dehydrogenase [Flavobacteriaceae bacterium]
MTIQKNTSLKNYNTFGIDVKATTFISIKTLSILKESVIKYKDFFLINGGSNMLLTKDIEKPVFHIGLKGIEIKKESKSHVYIEVQAGENWHQFVLWTLEKGFGGLENLALIPGNVGTSPIQNIGAYGVEVKDTLYEVMAYVIKTGKMVIFKNKDCHFGYRDSIFKNSHEGRYIITSVVFKLTTKKHKLTYSYGAIEDELELVNIIKPSIKDIANAIIKIRSEKLPDPNELGNSGSFFKNPVVSKNTFSDIKKNNPKMPYYIVEDSFKIPAGWLIEQCGFKGKRFGDAGVHKNQALVLVNYGNATGTEIYALAEKIQQTVMKKFDIFLEMEVNVY